MSVPLESVIPAASFVLGIIAFYQKWNDKITALSTNDTRQDTRLQHLEQDVDILKRVKHNL